MTPRRGALARTAATFSDLIARRLRRLVVNDQHWRIGLRRRAPGETPFVGLDRLKDPSWPGSRTIVSAYYADPFLFEDGGAITVDSAARDRAVAAVAPI